MRWALAAGVLLSGFGAAAQDGGGANVRFEQLPNSLTIRAKIYKNDGDRNIETGEILAEQTFTATQGGGIPVTPNSPSSPSARSTFSVLPRHGLPGDDAGYRRPATLLRRQERGHRHQERGRRHHRQPEADQPAHSQHDPGGQRGADAAHIQLHQCTLRAVDHERTADLESGRWYAENHLPLSYPCRRRRRGPDHGESGRREPSGHYRHAHKREGDHRSERRGACGLAGLQWLPDRSWQRKCAVHVPIGRHDVRAGPARLRRLRLPDRSDADQYPRRIQARAAGDVLGEILSGEQRWRAEAQLQRAAAARSTLHWRCDRHVDRSNA